ncbi:dihydropteroate synthase, partial [Mycobacterium avium]
MAIINRTPDSFYDRGATFSDDAARAAVHRAVAEGADVIDVGGVKAGPG